MSLISALLSVLSHFQHITIWVIAGEVCLAAELSEFQRNLKEAQIEVVSK